MAVAVENVSDAANAEVAYQRMELEDVGRPLFPSLLSRMENYGPHSRAILMFRTLAGAGSREETRCLGE